MNSAVDLGATAQAPSTVQLYVPDMRCAACAGCIEDAIRRAVPDARVTTNVTRQLVGIDVPADVALGTILDAVEAAGYTPTPTAADSRADGWRALRRDHLQRIGVAGIAMMQVMMVSLATYLAGPGGMDPTLTTLFRFTALTFCVPVVGYAALPFFRNAVASLRHGLGASRGAGLAMDVPVALAIGGAFAASVVATVSGTGEVYFDSVTMFTFLLLTARFLEQSLRGRLARMDQLLDLLPTTVQRVDPGGTVEIPLGAVRPGDDLLIKPGQRIPVDGHVHAGSTEVDEAALTGESAPRLRAVNDAVFAGTLNLAQPVTVRATRAGAATRLGSLEDLARRAEAAKPPVMELTDRIARIFVAGVLAIAALTALGWYWVDPGRALWTAVAVLVVSCPCALSLATPTAITAATVALRRRGFVVTRAHLLERLAGTTDVVFDKTGTLTTGFTELAAVEVLDGSREQCMADAAALERCFDHPYARAFRDVVVDAPAPVEAIRLVPGEGIEGTVEGRALRVGRPEFCGLEEHARDDGTTQLGLSRDGRPAARFHLRDVLRPGAEATVRALRADGLSVRVWSGDSEPATRAIADRLGGLGHDAGMTPEDKLALLRGLQSDGRSVLMVGDGINDVPSLAAATVAIAPLDATDLAKQKSDALLLSRSLFPLAEAFRVARRGRRIIRQNLTWAVAYNLACIPLAAFGIIPPWAAALGMSSSSLLVTLNACRLARARPVRDDGGMPWKA